jgi:hypothetical protein
MGFKSIFSGNKLNPEFTFSQKGNIWRMYFNNSGITAGETRDLYSKQAYLYSINYKSKKVYLKEFQLTEKWWFSIEGITDNHIIISHFVKPDTPEPVGIHVLDILTGKEIWRNDELIFLFASNEFVFGYKQLFESKIFYKLNAGTGEIMEEFREDVQIINILGEKSDYEEKQYEDYSYPELFTPGDEENLIKNYFSDDIKSLKLEGPLEYLQFNNFLIFNYHEKTGIDLKNIEKQILSNVLKIIDLRKNKNIFNVTLNKETSSYVPDSFFVKDGYLFFIREKKELTSINLNK